MNHRYRSAVVVGCCLALLLVGVILVFRPGGGDDASADALAPPWALLEQGERFERPAFPHEFSFPEDHGAHPGTRSEWWNLAGTLQAHDGARLGVRFTIVRLGLVPALPERGSRWATGDVYVGVFSITDPDGGTLDTDVRISRSAVGLAGASAEPRRVWVEDWRVDEAMDTDGDLVLTARSRVGGSLLTLTLEATKALLDANGILGENSDSRVPFDFYLLPRLRAVGRLSIGDREREVSGTLSMEHAWGELPLPGGPVALDTFTLHLDDGRELVLNRSHRVDGSGRAETTGLLIDADGRPTVLGSNRVELTPLDVGEADGEGSGYPVRWSLAVPDHSLDLVLSAHYRDQRGVAWLPFWAGPMRVSGSTADSPILGNGLAQLTGYESGN